MGAVEIIVIIAVIVVITVFVLSRRRKRSPVGAPEARAVEAAPPGAVEVEREERVVEAPAGPGSELAETPAVAAGAAGAAVEEGEAERAAAMPEEREVAAPAAKPEMSESELRARVKSQLEDSERMLGELRRLEVGAEGEAALDAGMVGIMEEGLQEVRALADRKQWSQARDKGQALHAQLSLMLRSARRERAS